MSATFTNPLLAGFSINFILRSSFKLKSGENPIVLKLSYLGERKEINTGLSVSTEHWVSGTGLVDHRYKAGKSINQQLYVIRQNVETTFLRMKEGLGDFRLSELVERMKGKQEPPQSIIEYVELKMEEIRKRTGTDLAITTYYKYNRTATYLKEYLHKQKGLDNLPVSRIDKIFLEGFIKFLRIEKRNSHNSSSSLVNCLKTILDEPVKRGALRYNPFKDVSLTRKPVIRHYLTMEEIILLQKLNGLTEAQSRKRDFFLFACFTGLAYTDICDLRGHHIIIDPDGAKHIEFYRNKTGVISYIPLISAAENILLKYSPGADCRDFQWKVPSNQKLNAALKTIARLAGIYKKLFMHLGRHTFATTVTLSQGVSIESVSKMLGHTSLKHTQLYAKIVNNRVKKDMEGVLNSFI